MIYDERCGRWLQRVSFVAKSLHLAFPREQSSGPKADPLAREPQNDLPLSFPLAQRVQSILSQSQSKAPHALLESSASFIFFATRRRIKSNIVMVDGLCVFGVFMLHLVSGIGLLLRGALLVSKKMLFLSISIDEVFSFIQRSVSPLFTLELF